MISTLIGENPHDIPRGRPLTEQPLPLTIPAGFPSTLLERRPDIRQAEQQLIAANAEIGVARAAFFPSLDLTASAGLEGNSVPNLFSANARAWTVTAPLVQPIFTAGKLQGILKLTEAEEQQMVLTYRQTIQQAFRQVSDALVSFQKYREFREHQEALTTAAQSASQLSQLRYKGGATSYLEVLMKRNELFRRGTQPGASPSGRKTIAGSGLSGSGRRLGSLRRVLVRARVSGNDAGNRVGLLTEPARSV